MATMIKQIMAKEYNKIKSDRKTLGLRNVAILFKAADNKYYACNRIDMKGVKEVFEFKKQKQEQAAAQENLPL